MMNEISAYNRPTFSWLADSSAPDVTSGVATFTYKLFDSGKIETLQLPFESFLTAYTVNILLDVAHEAGYEKGFAEYRAKVIAITGGRV
jgi:hypothetical protein